MAAPGVVQPLRQRGPVTACAHADAQPASDVSRRDALRALLASNPLDTDSRQELVRWHERRGEYELAAQEQRAMEEALTALGLG